MMKWFILLQTCIISGQKLRVRVAKTLQHSPGRIPIASVDGTRTPAASFATQRRVI